MAKAWQPQLIFVVMGGESGTDEVISRDLFLQKNVPPDCKHYCSMCSILFSHVDQLECFADVLHEARSATKNAIATVVHAKQSNTLTISSESLYSNGVILCTYHSKQREVKAWTLLHNATLFGRREARKRNPYLDGFLSISFVS